jgi:hypothetical protein
MRKTYSGLSACFLIISRSGIGSLHVRIAGLGSRASTNTEGGEVESGVGFFLNMLDFLA